MIPKLPDDPPVTLAVVTMVLNAEDWLRQTLPVWQEFADGIIALDDGSTDRTVEMLEGAGAQVESSSQDASAWGAEDGPRSQLFNIAQLSDYDYLFWLDMDMIPAKDPRPLIASGLPDSVCFRLYDMWDAESYREDGYWFGHAYPRTWLIRRPGPRFVGEWNKRGIHSGHLPYNLGMGRMVFAPNEYSLLHYAYAAPELRHKKLEQYRSVMDQLTTHELNHAESIGDSSPCLKRLPFAPEWPLDFSLARQPE